MADDCMYERRENEILAEEALLPCEFHFSKRAVKWSVMQGTVSITVPCTNTSKQLYIWGFPMFTQVAQFAQKRRFKGGFNMAKKNLDPQMNKCQLTINNPKEKNITHDFIINTAKKFKTLDYLAMADEQGSCYHTHVFLCFSSRVRFSTIKRAFPEAHIEIAKGTVTQNIEYIKKEGRWKDSKKSETSIKGTFEEFGHRPPDSRGKLSDMSDLYHMVNDGLTNTEILATNQDYILQIDKIDKLRTMLLTEKYKGIIRKDLRVIYVSGSTGTGKTSGVLAEHGAENVYRVTDYLHPFDGYMCQPVICFDEFRSSLYLKDMLNYCDIYPLELPARFSNKYACYDTVYIISNWSLEKQYAEVQKDDTESWEAFLRRISEVWVFESSDVTKKYSSVQEYYNRDTKFEKINDDKDVPF